MLRFCLNQDFQDLRMNRIILQQVVVCYTCCLVLQTCLSADRSRLVPPKVDPLQPPGSSVIRPLNN